MSDPGSPRPGATAGEIFLVFLRLGSTSFGGPVAHIGYFHDELVVRRRWLEAATYADLVALCQFLPGPASSQVGMAVGMLRGGWVGAVAAWSGFTLPSALLMTAFAFGVSALGDGAAGGWLHGLKIAAVAVVAQAVLAMARTLAPDPPRATLCVAAAATALIWPTATGQIVAIGLGALVGMAMLRGDPVPAEAPAVTVPVGRGAGIAALAVFAVLLIALPLLAARTGSLPLQLADSFYRSGSLVFGGGHVVLPLLQAEVVPNGLVSPDRFLAGYGAAQALPGPLFTFAAYLGATIAGLPGAVLGLGAIFLPSFLLVAGSLPFWSTLRARPRAQAALRGINAAVVGLLLAALYDPVWTAGIGSRADFALAAAAFLLLFIWKTPPWLVVAVSAAGGAILASLGL